MYNIERGRGPIIGDIINSSKFTDSKQDFLLGDEKFNFISRRIDDVSEGMVIKCFHAGSLKSNASQKYLKLSSSPTWVVHKSDHSTVLIGEFQNDFNIFFRRVWLYFSLKSLDSADFETKNKLNWITKFYQEMWKRMSRI